MKEARMKLNLTALVPLLVLALLAALPAGIVSGQEGAPAPAPAAPAPAPDAGQAPPTPTADQAAPAPEPDRGQWRRRRAEAENGRTFSLEVRNLDIDNLLKFYSDTFKWTVVKDPNCTGPVTIICPSRVTQDEALSVLNGVLEVRGFTSVLTGSLLKIVPLARAVQSRVDIRVGAQPAPLGIDQVITQIVPLKQAQAVNLQRELTPLITPGASLIASPASNTLIITDTASNVSRLLGIIAQLDSESPTGTRVFSLQHADAATLAPIISRLVATPTAAATTAGSTRQRGSTPESRLSTRSGQATAAGTAAPAAQAAVLADQRTNSLIVTAPPDKMQVAESVITSLDKEVPYESTTYVLPLQNAKALELATTLNRVFYQGGSARVAAPTTATQTRTPSRTRTSPGLRGGTSSQRSELDDGAADRMGAPPADDGQTGRPERAGQAYYQPGTTRTYQRPSGGTGGYYGGGYPGYLGTAGTRAEVLIVPEPNTNSLIINAPPEQIGSVRELVRQLDQVPTQVLIEVVIAEMNLDESSKLGVEWTWTETHALTNPELTGTARTSFGLDAAAQGFRYSLVGPSFSAVLSALASDRRANILSTPRIFTANNQPAQINISQQVPYIISYRETDNGTISYNYGYMDVGIVLDVTPQVSANGTVNLQVSQEANDLLGYTTFNAPIVARRSAQTSVSIHDGQTVVLGGIMKENRTQTVSKVPILGDLPLIGSLFRKKEVEKGKTELMVFMTPHVVRSPAEASAVTSEQHKLLGNTKCPPPSVPTTITVTPQLPEQQPGAPGAAPAPGPAETDGAHPELDQAPAPEGEEAPDHDAAPPPGDEGGEAPGEQ